MKKKRISLIALLIVTLACFLMGIAACDKTEGKREGAHIVVRAEQMEFAVAVGSEYTTPIAGVFDNNLDRIDGRTIVTSVYNASNALLEENTQQIHFRFISKGVWKIVYSAYIDGKKDKSIPETSIIVNVCSVLASPKNFKVENNTLTWDSIANAAGYEVSVNGGEPVKVDTEAFTSDIFEETGYYVSVKALGDNRNSLDSLNGTYRNRTPLKEGELMAFNDPNAVFDVTEAVAANITLPPDEIEWLSEEECPGSTGGALKFRIKSGAWGWGVFKLLTMDGVVLDSNDDWTGLEIRFKIDSEHYQAGSSRFTLSSAVAQSNAISRGMYVTQETNDQWLIIQLDKKYLLAEGYKKYTTIASTTATFADNVVTWAKNDSAYGYQVTVIKTDAEGAVTKKTYKDYSSENGFVVDETNNFSFDITGDTAFYQAEGCTYEVLVDCEIPATYNYVNFNMYNLVRTTGKGDIYIDYVRLYKNKLDAPQNLGYENGKIVWDAVDGAARYTLNIIKTVEGKEVSTHYDVKGCEFDLATIGLDPATTKFRAEVRAIPEDATYCSSGWTGFKAVEAPTDLAISDQGILTWAAVNNAIGYVVNVNGSELTVTENSCDITSYLTQDVGVKVRAIAGAGNLDGDYSNICAKIVLVGSQLATFNSTAYEGMITSLPKGEQGASGANSVNSVTYLDATACDGANGGAVKIVIKPKSGRQADFQITFAKAIDLTGYDGISIRFKVSDTSYYSNAADTSKLYLKLVNASGSTYTGCKVAKTVREVTETGVWMTVTFDDINYIKSCLLDGGTQLTFQLYMDGTFTPNAKGAVEIYLDEITFYTKPKE